MIPLSRSMDNGVHDENNRNETIQISNAIYHEIQECQSVLLNSTVLATVSPDMDADFAFNIWEHATRRDEDQTILILDQTDMLEQFIVRFPAVHQQEIVAAATALKPFGANLSMGLDSNGDISIASFVAKGVTTIDQVWSNSIFRNFYKTATHKESLYLSLKQNLHEYRRVQDGKDNAVWRASLKQCGMSKATIRKLLTGVAGLMLLGNYQESDEGENDFQEACLILGLLPTVNLTGQLIVGLFNRLMAQFVNAVNEAIIPALGGTSFEKGVAGVSSLVTLIQLEWGEQKSKQRVLNCAFHEEFAMNSEMISEGLAVPRAPSGLDCRIPAEPSVEVSDVPELEPDSVLAMENRCAAASINLDINGLVGSSRVWTILAIPKSQLREICSDLRFDAFVGRAGSIDFTADFDHEEFFQRYRNELSGVNLATLKRWASGKGFGSCDVSIGNERVWISEICWQYLESKRIKEVSPLLPPGAFRNVKRDVSSDYGDEATTPLVPGGAFGEKFYDDYEKSNSDIKLVAEYNGDYYNLDIESESVHGISKKTTYRRRIWLMIVYVMTWMIPGSILKRCGMTTAPQQTAWREKLTICLLVALINGAMVFQIIFLGKFLCPEFDHVWNITEVGHHKGDDDFFVAIHGKVYDMTKFYKTQHSDTDIHTNPQVMLQFAGKDLSAYFPKPLTVGCRGLVDDESIWLAPNNTIIHQEAIHYSGKYNQPNAKTKLHKYSWYSDVLEPRLEGLFKGHLVFALEDLQSNSPVNAHTWAIVNNSIYDLSDYFHTLSQYPNQKKYEFLNNDLKNLFTKYAGEDITAKIKDLNLSQSEYEDNMNCLNQVFYSGKIDFRNSMRCQFSNYMVIIAGIVLGTVVLIKFLSAFQYIGYEATLPMHDKFVVCHVPVYGEAEDEVRRSIESLAALDYPDERKLLFIVCDGMVVGNESSGHSTPRTLMRLLGNEFQPKMPSKAYKAVGNVSKQLNYGQVYSGVYGSDNHVVPYVVVIKTGTSEEIRKPGNRGKRDSQLLVMSFFNRVHHQYPMSPLELELFYNINNVIGIDPEVYEYLFLIGADTVVAPDSLNRLVDNCVNDSRIAGICGDIRLSKEEQSFCTKIQGYEYYISHRFTKAFESLFGFVTCLPGCLAMYRMRSTHNQPLVISSQVIEDYYEVCVDTLHQHNMVSLEEDRFLTSIMMKYFPSYRFKFNPHSVCYTTAPLEFKNLVSKRRREFSSTLHNLVELLRHSGMCGICCLGMRFFMFVDLAGTVLTPSVCICSGYLLYLISNKSSAFALISIVVLASVYGLQELTFVAKCEWQQIGWMIFYLTTYPVHSFILSLYSFWVQDYFSWGSSRKSENDAGKGLLSEEDIDNKEYSPFDERSVPRQLWTAYALVNGLQGAHRDESIKDKLTPGYQQVMTQSQYQDFDQETLYGDKSYIITKDNQGNTIESLQSTPDSQSTLHEDTTRVRSDEEIRNSVKDILLCGAQIECDTINQLARRVETALNTDLDEDQLRLVYDQLDQLLNAFHK